MCSGTNSPLNLRSPLGKLRVTLKNYRIDPWIFIIFDLRRVIMASVEGIV